MIGVWTWLQSSAVELLVLTLLNSLWQGAVWLLLLMVLLRALPARRANLRYGISVASLLGIIITGVVTWSLMNGNWRRPDVAARNPQRISDLQTEAESTPATVAEDRPYDESTTNAAMTIPQAATTESLTAGGSVNSWFAWCAVVWACGCFLMLVRGLRNIIAARSLVRGPACDDPALLNVLSRLQLCVGLRRPVRLVITDALSTPAVWGLWKPVLLLPASLAGNLSVAELEAVFAHELAHVHRWDHVVNLLQLLVESALFFNPAVWWISRQIRVEREACCDAAAARLTDNPVGYAALLAAHAEQRVVTRATAVLAMNASQGSLVDRVRRLLLPAHRPGMRLSWWACLLLIAVSGAVLYGLLRGTDVAVQVAAEMMSDEERVDAIAEQARRVAPGIVAESAFDKVRIRGRVLIVPALTTVDEVSVDAFVRKENHSHMGSIGTASDEFDVTVEAGQIWLFFYHRDAAVSILGPFGPQDGPDITDQLVVVTEGKDVSLRVVDEMNQPAAGVTVSASAVVNGNGIGSARGVTNEEGIVHLSHISPDNEYSLLLSGPGYQQTDPPDGKLDAAEVATFTVSRAVPAHGLIIDEQGEPISGVQIREYIAQREHFTNSTGGLEDPIATTNRDGEFLLDSLLDGYRYHLLLQHPQFADAILPNVHPGDDSVHGTMVRGVTVTGAVNGADGLPAEKRRLYWGEVVQLPLGERGGLRRHVMRHRGPASFDEDGRFTLARVAPGPVEMRIGAQTQTFDVSPESTQVTINYEPVSLRETRQLVIRFEHNGQFVRPKGRLELRGLSSEIDSTVMPSTELRLADGVARADVPVPMTRPTLHADADGLIGYWFNSLDLDWPVLQPGDEPFELVIPVVPAGAIEGQITTSDGLPATGVSVGATIDYKYPTTSGRWRTYGGGLNARTDTTGRFFLTPLPLGASCVVTLSDGFYRQAGEEIVLEGDAPLRTVNLSLGQRKDVSGQVLGPDGQPMRGVPVELYFSHPRGSMSWSPPDVTDSEGRFSFSGLNASADGLYRADLKSDRDYVPQRATVRFGEPNVIQLEVGRVLTGRTLDEHGRPVPGIEVYAMRADLDLSPNAINSFEAEAASDADGRFRFSNLPDVRLKINARQLQNERQTTVEPGDTKEITLEGEVVAWYREKLDDSGE